MTQITASTPSTALNTASMPWRNPIHVMSDGYRAVVYSDGTNIVVKTSSNGSSWSGATTIAGGTMTQLVDSVIAGNTLVCFVAGTSSVTAYMLAYSGAGAFGALTNLTILSALSYTVQSIRAVYDPDGTTSDSQHTTGTGIIHLLVDSGANWNFYALDLNTSASKPKIVTTYSLSNGITTPTYATNMIGRTKNKIYAISSAGSNGWKAYEVVYSSSTTTSVGTNTNLAAFFNTPDAGYVGSSDLFWLNAFATSSVAAGYYQGTNISHSGSGTVNPVSEGGSAPTSPSTWGQTIPGFAGGIFPAGTWTLNLTLQTANMLTNTVAIQARLYDNVSGTKTLIGTLAMSSPVSFGSAGSTGYANIAVSSQAIIAAHTFSASSSLYVEYDLLFSSALTSYTPNAPQSSFLNVNSGILYPTQGYTSTGTTTTTNAYVPGSAETPPLPNSSYGAALALAGSNATDNPVNVFVAGVNNITYMQRSVSGLYSAQQNLAASNLLGTSGLSATGNVNTGDLSVFGAATFSGVLHVGIIKKTGGVWGTFIQWDTSAALIQSGYGSTDPNTMANVGNAVVYTNGPNPYNLQYEDVGFSSTGTAPTVTNVIMASTSPTVNDVFGAPPNFNVLSANPVIQFQFNSTVSGDTMASYRIVVTRTDVSSTVWDTGQVAAVGTILNGATYSVPYAGTGLVGGGLYSVMVYVWEAIALTISAASAAIAFSYVSAPTVAVTAPTLITSLTPSVTFTYNQSQGRAAQSYQIQVIDAFGVIAYDTGNVPQTIASGNSFTTGSGGSSNVVGATAANAGSLVVTAGQGSRFTSGASITVDTGANTDTVIVGGVTGDTLYAGKYSDVVIRGGAAPVLYYRFNETSGTAATDSSGNGRTGLYTGGYTLNQTGAINDGTPSLGLAAKSFTYTAGTGLPVGSAARSVDFWMLFSGTGAPFVWGTQTTNQMFGLNFPDNTHASIDIAGNSVSVTIPNYNDGYWHHFVVTLSGTAYTLYMDGALKGSGNFGVTPNTVMSANGLWLGSYADLNGPFTGRLDEFAVYSRVLTSGEALAHYTLGKSATGALAHAHANGVAISGGSSSINLTGLVNNLQNYAIKAIAYVNPVIGSSWSGSGTLQSSTQFPSSPIPTGVTATPVTGTTPNTGGYIRLNWNQTAGNNLSQNKVYQRPTGTQNWTLIATVTAVVGANMLKSYWVGNGVAYDFAISSVTTGGVESAIVPVLNTTLFFRLGLWINDPVNPSTAIELGMLNVGDSFPQLEPIQDKDQAQLFSRTNLVMTVGSIYSYHIPETIYQLEVGQESICLTALKVWDQYGITIQLRTPYGDIMQAVILNAKPGARNLIVYRTVAVEFQASEPSIVTTPTGV